MPDLARRPLPLLLLLVLLLGSPGPVTAQGTDAGWPAIQVGAHLGYDDNVSATVAGAQIRIPVLPGGQVELVPSADATFLNGLTEYQFNADAVYLTGGRGGGLYGGGGVVFRNSIYETGPDRETRTGASAVVGLVTRSALQGVPLGVQLEARWVFIDAEFDPRIFSFGVNLPLWGWGEAGRRR